MARNGLHNTNARLLASMMIQMIIATYAASAEMKDIRSHDEHFLGTDEDMKQWTFFPQDNIDLFTTTEHPGLLMLRDAGKGTDIKGVPKDPIRLDEYPMPWEFKMGLLQPEPKAGDAQTNYAFGINVLVTFSEPSSWPDDRTVAPPDSRSLQLLVVRLGNYGEVDRRGVPQLRYSELNYGDPSPEVYLLWGRGDLANNVIGDWRIPYTWVGYQSPALGQLGAAANWSWGKHAGPAESNGLQDIRFRFRVVTPTKLEIGFGYGYRVGWRMRTIDVAHLGEITGIWEVGPIISLDRWMADELAPALPIYPVPELEEPDTGSAYYIDYLTFFGNGPESFEHLSDEFDMPGLPADHK